MTYNPRRLAHGLETLSKELLSWSCVAREAHDEAEYQQRQDEEAQTQAIRQMARIINGLVADNDMFEKTKEKFDGDDKYCQEVGIQAEQTLSLSHLQLALADTTQKKWKAELEKAKAWLERAHEKLAKARDKLQEAQTKLAGAREALYRAENASRSSKSSWGDGIALRQAQASVAHAEKIVRVAEEEVRSAEQEVEKAKARVNACFDAVSLAEQAVKLAQSTVNMAQQGCDYAARDREHMDAARNALDKAKKELDNEQDAVNEMQEFINASQLKIEESLQYHKDATYYDNSVYDTSYRARKVIEDRIHYLYNQDRADLYANVVRAAVPLVSVLATSAAVIFNNPQTEAGARFDQVITDLPVIVQEEHHTPLEDFVHKKEQVELVAEQTYDLLEKRQELLDSLQIPEHQRSASSSQPDTENRNPERPTKPSVPQEQSDEDLNDIASKRRDISKGETSHAP